MSLNIDAERISTASDRGCTRSGTGAMEVRIDLS